MDVHILGWIGLAAIILTLIVIDIVGHVRTPHEPTMKEAAVWSVAYIGMALVFGGIVWFVWGGGFAQEYLCLLYTSPSPRDRQKSRMPSSA